MHLPNFNRNSKRTVLSTLVVGLAFGYSSLPSAIAQNAVSAAAKAPTVPSFPCGGLNPIGVQLKPIPKLSNGEFTNPGADCAMWQTFIYLNWPAKAGQRGIPDTSALFGAPGTTVWESFLTEEQVFLPNGAKPQPWDNSVVNAARPKDIASEVAVGGVRMLTRTAKVSPTIAKLQATLKANKSLAASTTIPLDEITQSDGNILYDQQKNPVYYDVAMNKAQYDYITQNSLYNATSQATFTKKTNIVLPSGSIEVKAAWKVLTAAEAGSGRFHVAKGYIPGASGGKSVTIGLVGFHIFASGGKQNAGLWATFYQVDNAPLMGATSKQNYSFNNPASNTAVNTKGTNPTQVAQVFPDDVNAAQVNTQAQKIIIEGFAKSPWQYYAMIDTQWSKTVLNLTTPVPLSVPLSPGKPGDISTNTLINPVLETFMQTKGNSCMGCHSFATTAQKGSKTATGFSFMFGNAQAPK
jgi:hypothetical protein